MIRFSLSFTDWVYNMYLASYTGTNRSKFIEGNFVKGIMTETGVDQCKLLELIEDNRKLKSGLAESNRIISVLKEKLTHKRKTPEPKIEVLFDNTR